MAKQSGLHQIKGKVGEHSYYRQTGVSGGLIRSINQGLSDRVKNAPEYANTRLNNAEFGAACNVAAILGQLVIPKFRPMILPFSQSRMAKAVLKIAKQNAEAWGERTVGNGDTAALAEILTAQSKINMDEFFVCSVGNFSDNEGEATVILSEDTKNRLISLGADKLSISCRVFNVGTGRFNEVTGEMSTSYKESVDTVYPVDEIILDSTEAGTFAESIDVPAFVPAPNHSGHQIAVFVATPIRTVNGDDYVLQEHCMFKALPIVLQ